MNKLRDVINIPCEFCGCKLIIENHCAACYVEWLKLELIWEKKISARYKKASELMRIRIKELGGGYCCEIQNINSESESI